MSCVPTATATTNVRPDIVVLCGPVDQAAKWLKNGGAATVRIVATPRAVLQELGQEATDALQITNMVCLEDCHELYPFLGKPWDGTEADARSIVTWIFRYRRVVTTLPLTRSIEGITVTAEPIPPTQLILVTQYYKCSKTKRQKELDLCLKKNIECPYVDRIVLLNESAGILIPHSSPKIRTKSIGARLNFREVIRWIYDEAPAGSIIAVANSDIYLDESWLSIWSINMKDKFLSLLRWDDQPDEDAAPVLFGPRADSQDTWVIAADSVKERKWNWDAINIPFGKGGCDNAINVEMLKQRFLVVNPAHTLVTHHVHMSEYRTYNPLDIVDRPFYMHIHPTGIHDLKPERNMPAAFKTFEEPTHMLGTGSHLTVAQRNTFRTMAARNVTDIMDGYILPPTTVPIYEFTNVFQTATGLVSDYTSIYIGPTKAGAEMWSREELSKVAPCLDTAVAFVAPCPDTVMTDTQTYCLKYLGKVFAMRQATGLQGEFLGENSPACTNAYHTFTWPETTIPVLSRSENFQDFCRKAYVWHPQDGFAARPTRAEVDALRASLRKPWTPSLALKQPRRIVCITDRVWLSPTFLDSLEQQFTVDTISTETLFQTQIDILRGATDFVFVGGPNSMKTWGAAWALPRGATLWELQFEMHQSLDVAAFAAIADLKYNLLVTPRPNGPPDAIKQFCKTLKEGLKKSNEEEMDPKKPKIFMPVAEGFFSHAGDSFREMVYAWKGRGYVNVLERKDLCNVWLGDVGDVLLYDRPTMEWMNRSPIEEKQWRLALFGNPAPMAANAKSWIFWPRVPATVEELVDAGEAERPFGKRSKSIVFYGRSENSTQRERRMKESWGSALGPKSDFIHQVKADESYPFTHREYLLRLANSRFGLCLAGYGYKCHREVECMAMGCVPVVAPEVDMTNYADPPVEGVHYFRVFKPAEIVPLMESVTEEKWSAMSAACKAWWRKNASVEGSWETTKRLARI